VTPDGYGDAVQGEYFVTPDERQMLFTDFIDILEKKKEAEGIYYCQHQNSSFTSQFSSLHKDIRPISFAVQAFAAQPDAINFWMGNEKSLSVLHHDPYENIYAVVAGEKRFRLYPPTALYWLEQKEYKKAKYTYTSQKKIDQKNDKKEEFIIVPDPTGAKVPWFDLENPREEKKVKMRALEVTVKKGEVLFLPALWYHRVSQKSDNEGRTIAVNFWYDMAFDFRYVYFKFMESVIKFKTDTEKHLKKSKKAQIKKVKKKKKNLKIQLQHRMLLKKQIWRHPYESGAISF